MTDAMLRLARAVYPEWEWKVDEGRPYRMVRIDRYEIFAPDGHDAQYSMASRQFCDVLAWALDNGINVRDDEVFWYPTIETIRAERISHDGTASGIRAAVVEAARRVVK